jgi:NTP pyrophosphatase (non-canonical NTP hydrolase)
MTEQEEDIAMADLEEMAQSELFDSYQDFAETTAIYPPEKALEYLALGLASEAGEVAGKIKKLIRDGGADIEDIAAELGDVLWYAANLCSELDLFMSDVVEINVEKLKGRLMRGTLKGSGDKR